MNIDPLQFLILVWMAQVLSSSITSAQECKPGNKPRRYKDDYVLLSSAYKKTITENFEACYTDCLVEVECSSINFYSTNGTCELINVTKSCFPSRFVPHEKSIYAEARKQDGCRDLLFLDCLKNKALIDHVISNFSLKVPALKECQQKCLLETKCVSYNLGPVRGQNRSCELNAADHSTRLDFLVPKEGYDYCIIWNPCQSNPCPAGRLCTPDLTSETFSCDDGGWTQWGSWNTATASLLTVCTRARIRTCSSPAPQNQGAQCTGPALEAEAKGECIVSQPSSSGGTPKDSGNKLMLRAENGNYLSIVLRGNFNSIQASKKTPDADCVFEAYNNETEGTALLKANNGKYLCWVYRSGIHYIDAEGIQPAQNCRFKVLPQLNGKVSFLAKNGKHWSRMYRGIHSIEAAKPKIDGYSQFKCDCKQ